MAASYNILVYTPLADKDNYNFTNNATCISIHSYVAIPANCCAC